YSIVKKPTNAPSVKPFPQSPELSSRTPQSAPSQPGNSRAKVVVASSAAALVSDRAYRPPSSQTSTGIFMGPTQISQPIEIKRYFYPQAAAATFRPRKRAEIDRHGMN
ncbi:hypothetical protein, partial [Ensifer sp. Root423]|uniref:hypothetical protein n=1 Tax=Ensifer sp. Root423 TaxID=1736534 RepID=UPI001AEC8E20